MHEIYFYFLLRLFCKENGINVKKKKKKGKKVILVKNDLL